MLKFFAIIALLIIPCSATISVHIDTSTPNGLGISTGYSLDGRGQSHIETILDPMDGFLKETGDCQGTCGSWISFGMISPHGVITTFLQDFSAHNRDTSWWYGVGNGMIGTSVAIK